MRAMMKLLTVLAAATFATAGCDDGNKNDKDTIPDEDVTDVLGGDDADDDTGNGQIGEGDTDGGETPNPCGTRECGNFGGQNCGTCEGGLECNALGKCTAPPSPYGGLCDAGQFCDPNSNDYEDCMHNSCETFTCLGLSGQAFIFRNVCTKGCTIYEDKDKDGINDIDAGQEDCAGAIDGPTGASFRCANIGDVNNPVGICLPGSEFAKCSSNTDCPDDESCELTRISTFAQYPEEKRCIAKYREVEDLDYEVAGVGERCDELGESGTPTYCGGSFCFSFGCTALCEEDTDCGDKFHCEYDQDIFGVGGNEFLNNFCFPPNCETNADCSEDSYCRFFWNGEIGEDAALESMCLPKTPGGAAFGEECRDTGNPRTDVLCEDEDMCFSGRCSALCVTNDDCGLDDAICTFVEMPGNSENPESNDYDFVIPFGLCMMYPGHTSECLRNDDCAVGEACRLFEIQNFADEAAGILDADAPYKIAGVCEPFDLEEGEGTYLSNCEVDSDCRYGHCQAFSGGISYCLDACEDTSDCNKNEPYIDEEGEFRGICQALQLGWSGNANDETGFLYVGACILDEGSRADCSDDFTCPGDDGVEACIPNVIPSDPTRPAVLEFICVEGWNRPADRGTAQLGEDCTSDAACHSAICHKENESDAKGYCTELCKSDDSCNAEGFACLTVTKAERRGAYESNSVSYKLCLEGESEGDINDEDVIDGEDVIDDEDVIDGEDVEEPGEDVEEPSEDVEEPGEDVEEPGEDVEEPGEDVEEPGEDVEEPGEDVEEPGEDVEEPGEDVEEPGEDVEEPGEDVEEPGEDVQEPGNEP